MMGTPVAKAYKQGRLPLNRFLTNMFRPSAGRIELPASRGLSPRRRLCLRRNKNQVEVSLLFARDRPRWAAERAAPPTRTIRAISGDRERRVTLQFFGGVG